MSKSQDFSVGDLPEVFRSNADISAAVSAGVSAGEARKIAPNLYTHNMDDRVDDIVRRNLWPIVHLLYPHTIVSHRTAFEMQPAESISSTPTSSGGP